jgi:heat shock protein HslJ
MPKSLLLLLLALALAAGPLGCSAAKAGSDNPAPGEMPALNQFNLAGTSWVLTGYGDALALTNVIPGTRVTLAFNASLDGVGGNAGANHYGGSLNVHDGQLTISELFHTEMWGLTPGVMEQEARYLELLSRAESWRVEDGRLTINSQGGQVLVMSQDTQTAVPLANLAGTNWILNSFGSGDAVTSVIAGTSITLTFNQDASMVVGNAGANGYGGYSRITGSEISIRELAHELVLRLEPPGIMEQEAKFLTLLAKATSFQATTQRLTIDCQDGQFLVFTRGE